MDSSIGYPLIAVPESRPVLFDDHSWCAVLHSSSVFLLGKGWERIYGVKQGEAEAFIKVGELFGFTAGFFLLWAILEADSFVEMVKGSVKLNSKFCPGKISVEQ